MAEGDAEIWQEARRNGMSSRDPAVRGMGGVLAMAGQLKTRLTVAAMAGLVLGIGFVSLLLQHRVESDLISQTREREVAQTAALAADLSRRVVSLQQALRSTADQIDPALERMDASLERHLQGQPALRQVFSNLFVAAPDGRMRLVLDDAGPRRPLVSIADRDYFRKVIEEKRPIISGAVPGRISNEPVIIFSHPIVREGRVTSVIGGGIRLSSRSLAAFVVDRGDESTQAELLAITDEQGQVLAHPVRNRLLSPLSEDAELSAAVDDWQRRGAPIEPSGLLLTQPGAIVSAAGVAGTGWVVWRALPESILLRPLHASRLATLRDASLAIGVLGLLTFWLVTRQLRSLRLLQDRASRLFDPTIDIHQGWPHEAGEIGAVVQVLRHVGAERAQLESFTRQLLGRLDSVMAAAPLGIAFTRNQNFELVSKAWCHLLQRDEAELLGTATRHIFAIEDEYEQLGIQVRTVFGEGADYVGDWRFRRKDGSWFWGQLRGRPVDPQDPGAGTIWTLSDVTQIRANQESLEWLARHDPLTGLANRAAFQERLNVVIHHPPAALLAIDLDHFKPINDAHGHGAGDAMLKQIAVTMSAHVRGGDLVVRTGGDEFAVILERCPPDAAQRVAAELRRAIDRAEVEWQGRALRVGASVGVAPLNPQIASVEAWVAAADQACYSAKSAGRGAVHVSQGSTGNVVPIQRYIHDAMLPP